MTEAASEAASPREQVEENDATTPETERLIDPSNESAESMDADPETEPVVGDTSTDPEAKSE